MKKLILFAILFAFFSCNQGSGSDDFDINNITGGTSSGISKASRIKRLKSCRCAVSK
ncbi:hypothetical protein [Ornithobacterium rhinotracheale]|uniref:hypothetical protein n=1 Tax=Ornithobacterium rhinotracheale TaxID=28251 RepID=UPI0038739EDA